MEIEDGKDERKGFESCLQNQGDCSWAVFSLNKQGSGEAERQVQDFR